MIEAIYQRAVFRLMNAFNTGDFEAYLKELAPDVTFRGPLSGESSAGHATVRSLLLTARDRLRLRKLEAGEGYQSQHQVALQFTGTAEAPGGGTVNIKGILMVDFRPDGLIQDIRFFWDPKPLLPHLTG